MKDDFYQAKENFSNKNSSLKDEDSLDWAKRAYLQLKQKQTEEKEIREKEIKANEIINTKNVDNSFTNNLEQNDKTNISAHEILKVSQDLKEEDQPELGDFDDTFTWSAEVLAAQGKKIDQFSLDEIDWLSRLKQGLE